MQTMKKVKIKFTVSLLIQYTYRYIEYNIKKLIIKNNRHTGDSITYDSSRDFTLSDQKKIFEQKILNYRVYALLSDGECNEGTIWESAMFASAQKISNLTIIIDYNKWQATGRSKEILALEPFRKKWEAFGWHTEEINGHDFEELSNAFKNAKEEISRPSAIVAHTIKGKGISFMEDDNNWHYRTPNDAEFEAALKELNF